MKPGGATLSQAARTLEAWCAALYPRAAVLIAIGFLSQYYMVYAKPYLNMARFAAGQERMPFQARELMRYPLGWAMHSTFLQRLTAGHRGSGSPALLFTEVSAFISLALACLAAQRIYRWAVPEAPPTVLPSALLLVICLFDYCLSVPYGFPYDLPSVAFIGWGLWFVLTEKFWPLLLLLPLATWNRETSLFLLLAIMAVSASRAEVSLSQRFLPNLRDLLRLGLLFVLWVAVYVLLKRRYAGQATEEGSRILKNLHDLANPVHWFSFLSASAFLIPYVWLGRSRIRNPGLRACVLVVPFWFLFLLWKGQVLEVRIYGDVSVLIAVAAAIIFLADAASAALSGRSSTLCEAARSGDSLKTS